MKVGVLVRLRNLMIPMGTKLQRFKSIILPNLTYCHTAWYFCKAQDITKLEKVQECPSRAVNCNIRGVIERGGTA